MILDTGNGDGTVSYIATKHGNTAAAFNTASLVEDNVLEFAATAIGKECDCFATREVQAAYGVSVAVELQGRLSAFNVCYCCSIVSIREYILTKGAVDVPIGLKSAL